MKRISLVTLLVLSILAWQASAAFAATSDSLAVSATIQAGTSTLSVTEANLTFGNISPSEADHRFVATAPFHVNYFAATGPWGIRVYTDNASGDAGLIGADGTPLVLKLWNDNRGGTGNPPDPELDSNWKLPNPVWSYVPDKDDVDVFLCQSGGAELPSGFANELAVDAEGMKAQAYSTSSLTVEIIILP